MPCRISEGHDMTNEVESCQHLLPLLYMGLTDESQDIGRQTLDLVEASGEVMCTSLALLAGDKPVKNTVSLNDLNAAPVPVVLKEDEIVPFL